MTIALRCRHRQLLQFIGRPLFVSELLKSGLRKVLSQRALRHKDIICFALDVAWGLNYLHLSEPSSIIHRDISSSNVLLWQQDDSLRAKLADDGSVNFMHQCLMPNPGERCLSLISCRHWRFS